MSGFKLECREFWFGPQQRIFGTICFSGLLEARRNSCLIPKNLGFFDAQLHSTDRPQLIIAPPKLEKPRL